MSSGTKTERFHTAAWRISTWSGLAFACGTLLVFISLHRFVAADIQRRSDAWLTGEVKVLSDVAEETPRDRRYSAVVSEVAELASREVPNRLRSSGPSNDSVFFLQTSERGNVQLWVGSGDGGIFLRAIQSTRWLPDVPADIHVSGSEVPFRVASVPTDDGGHIYLGLSERDELHVLRNLRARFIAIGAIIVGFGFLIVFTATRKMLQQVQDITAAASRIGQSDIRTRVPMSGRHDEIGQLSKTLNGMLDRIESSIHQLHTITDAVAHDLRSPLTAVRGRLELALASDPEGDASEQLVSAIDEIDRLNRVLTTSLDVAEADANALRLRCEEIELGEVVQGLVELYEPSMAERDLHVSVTRDAAVYAWADSALLHRLIANLLDNEMKHIPSGCRVDVRVHEADGQAVMVWEDDGPGFGDEIRSQLFDARAKGSRSAGYGLGLAFVQAVTRAQGGSVVARNRSAGGAQVVVALPVSDRAMHEPAGRVGLSA